MDTLKKPVLYVSYSNKDRSLVDHLVRGLQEANIDTIYDATLIEDGSDWRESLENGLANADGILVLLTPNSISSEYVISELGAARVYSRNQENPKLLLPLVYGMDVIPKSVSDLQVIKWVEGEQDKIVQRIAKAAYNFIKRHGGQQPTEPLSSQPEKLNENAKQPSANTNQKRSAGSKETPQSAAVQSNHWLLKMNPNVWPIELLKPGETTFFSTYYFQTKRPEYELFQKIRTGDKVIGYAAGKYQSVVCLMKVTEPVGPDSAQGEMFKMQVTQLLSPHISLEHFKNKILDILPRLQENKRPPELFFELSTETYQQILGSIETFSPYENTFRPFYLTEGNHTQTDDQLEFENDIDSFASVIALKKVNPPLAIGLFGNWGSGKSFFMEKLGRKIEDKASSEDPDYVRHVVHVRFNSWHYSDANLWASIITHIFESLNDYAKEKKDGKEAIAKLYKKLDITEQQINETETKIAAHDTLITDLQQQQTEIQTIIDEKKKTLGMFNNRQIADIIMTDPLIRKDLQEILVRLNIGEISKSLKGLEAVKQDLTKDVTAVQNLAELVHQNLRGKRLWIIFFSVLFILIMTLVYSPIFSKLSDFLDPAIKNISATISFITALLVLYRNKLSPHMQELESLYRRVASVRHTLTQKVNTTELNEDILKRNLDTEIESLQAKNNAIKNELKQRQNEKKQLKVQLSEIGSGKMLANFLAGKSADDGYMKQLGIISWIRKDFSKLNDLFRQQETVNEKNAKQTIEDTAIQLKIDRIVLYIDDLDRCNEDIVVKVLEAIHLLLAFELFVVVVGVDPRWLNNALSEKYKTLFGANKENGQNTSGAEHITRRLDDEESLLSGVATSYDYLEKIFQIPFTLKPINKTGRDKLIGYLIKDELLTENPQTINAIPKKPDNHQPPKGPENPPPRADTGNKEEPKKQAELLKLKKEKQRLVFTQDELAYMQKVSGLFGHSPRSINRYINIYRIIKAHKGMRVFGDFSRDEFIPIMFTLGIAVGYPAFAQHFIDKMARADDRQAFKNFIIGLGLGEKMMNVFVKYTDAEIGEMPMENFQRNLGLISRFSFRTLLSPQPAT